MLPKISFFRAVAIILPVLMIVVPVFCQQENQKKRPSGFKIGVSVDLVTLDVTVLYPDGRIVEGLTRDDFVLMEDGKPQDISLFQEADLPISLGMVIDTSGSMRNKIRFVNQSIFSFLDNSNYENELFIVDFAHSEAELLQDFTQDQDEVRDAITDKMLAGGGSPLWDSIYLALGYIERGMFARKALVVISDGEDKDSYYDYDDVSEQLKVQDSQLFFIGIQERRSGKLFDLGSFSREEAKEDMQHLSRLGGGMCYFPEHLDDLDDITVNIANELRHQYRIGFRPDQKNSKKGFRTIEVHIKNRQNYTVRTRDGYVFSEETSNRTGK